MLRSHTVIGIHRGANLTISRMSQSLFHTSTLLRLSSRSPNSGLRWSGATPVHQSCSFELIFATRCIHILGSSIRPQVARILQASWGRCGKLQHEQNSPNLGPSYIRENCIVLFTILYSICFFWHPKRIPLPAFQGDDVEQKFLLPDWNELRSGSTIFVLSRHKLLIIDRWVP